MFKLLVFGLKLFVPFESPCPVSLQLHLLNFLPKQVFLSAEEGRNEGDSSNMRINFLKDLIT